MDHAEEFLKIVNEAKSKISEIDSTQLLHLLQSTQCLCIDVRELDEWTHGHIPNATHLSKGVLERDITKVEKNLNREIVLYCAGGYRSAISAYNLQKMGFTNVHSLKGGFRDWTHHGFEVAYD